MLKPKELMMCSMTLEEADEWFESYRAFLAHNERTLARQDIKVSRALLNRSIEAGLASSLRAPPRHQSYHTYCRQGWMFRQTERHLLGEKSFVAQEAQLL